MIRQDAFTGKISVVTGAASGMGAATARFFAEHGGDVVLADWEEDRLAATVNGLSGASGTVLGTPVDLADTTSISQLFETVDDRFGRIDNVVNCAGIMSSVRMDDVTPQVWDNVLAINLRGVFFLVQEAYRRMAPAGLGNIVLVASDAAKRGGGGLIADIPYAASKAGVTSIVKSVSRAMAGSGVRINGICPGASDTPMHGTVDAETKARIAAGIPIGRMGTPLDMARVVAFLCTDLASYVYGESINVDGGTILE